MFGNQNIHFWEGLFSKCFFLPLVAFFLDFWNFRVYFCCCFCCLVLKTLKVFLESEYVQFGGVCFFNLRF